MNSWGREDPDLAVGGLWEEIGALQLRIMRSAGLEPRHRFLDVGAGSLRGGLHFVRYLEAGNYWGTDLSSILLEAGRRNLVRAGLTAKMPNLSIANDFRFAELDGQLFDYALAFGVFTDVPAESVRECLANLGELLVPNGIFLATFAMNSQYSAHRSRLQFRHPWSFFVDLASEFGWDIELVNGFKHPKGHSLLVARLPDIRTTTTI